MEKLFARLRPYSPERQPHKSILIAHLNLGFKEGRWVLLPQKISGGLKNYLERQYPGGDESRGCSFEVVTEDEMIRIRESEEKARELKNIAALHGLSVEELKRERKRNKVVEDWDFQDRDERLRKRKPTELEKLALELEDSKDPTEEEELFEDADAKTEEEEVWAQVQNEMKEEVEEEVEQAVEQEVEKPSEPKEEEQIKLIEDLKEPKKKKERVSRNSKTSKTPKRRVKR